MQNQEGKGRDASVRRDSPSSGILSPPPPTSASRTCRAALRKCDLPCDKALAKFEFKHHNLSPEEVDILSFRFDFPVQTLCHDHYLDQFNRYSSWQKKCSDPCLRHSKPVKIRLNDISLELAKQVTSSTEHRVIPGKKLCRPCEAYLKELIESNELDNAGEIEHCEDRRHDVPDHPDLEILEFDSPEFDSPQFDSPM